MKLRVTGTRAEVDALIDRIKASKIGIVNEVSRWYPWKRNDPDSKLGSRYVDISLDFGELINTRPLPPEPEMLVIE